MCMNNNCTESQISFRRMYLLYRNSKPADYRLNDYETAGGALENTRTPRIEVIEAIARSSRLVFVRTEEPLRPPFGSRNAFRGLSVNRRF